MYEDFVQENGKKNQPIQPSEAFKLLECTNHNLRLDDSLNPEKKTIVAFSAICHLYRRKSLLT